MGLCTAMQLAKLPAATDGSGGRDLMASAEILHCKRDGAGGATPRYPPASRMSGDVA